MTNATLIPQDALELQARSLEALTSLLRALDATNDVDGVARRALLTVSGQLLVRRSALFVLEDGGSFALQGSVGVVRDRIDVGRWRAPERFLARLRSEDGVMLLRDTTDLPVALFEPFERVAHLTNDDQTVGLLFLGGALGSESIAEQDRQLMRTMGVVIGTTLHRVQVQQQLIEARLRLDEAQRMRKSIVDHVSHEFNTPLLIVKSTGDMIRSADDDAREELLGMHEEAVGRLEQLVGSILRVAQEFDGNVETEIMPLTMVAREIIDPWLLRETDSKNLRCILESSSEVFVRASSMRLEILLKELVDNARDALTDEAPWVVIQLYVTPSGWWGAQDQPARLQLYRDALGSGDQLTEVLWSKDSHDLQRHGGPEEVVLEVMDLGQGIPEDEIRMIFEPFAQGRNSSRRGIEGAGMGLPTCRQLASEMHGRMLVHSTEGLGTSVALILPVCEGI